MTAHPTPLKPVRRWKAKNFLDHQHLQPSTNSEKYENIALEFRLFSKDVMTLFDCFSQFPQFVEELPDWSLAEELQVGVICIIEKTTTLTLLQGMGELLGQF